MTLKAPLLPLLVALASCAPPPPGIDFRASEAAAPLVAASLEFLGDPRVLASASPAPLSAPGARAVTVAVVERTDCTECYRIDRRGDRYVITGGLPLGVQYGVAHLLELHGYRFHHPWRTYVPASYLAVDASALGVEHAPETDVRRGLHLHTLHPIEALYDFWVPSAKNLEGARRTVDFIVKNRGNFMSSYALDDITPGGEAASAWRAHTKKLLAYAQSRGLKVSVTVQLFGKSNLQRSFDLIDDDTLPDPIPELERRLHVLLDETPYDSVNLSFGEFFKADPAVFVRRVDDAYAALQRVRPGLGVTAAIHVGDTPELRVEYQGRSQLYYFLVRYANPAIVPWVHTVFFYNLYDPASGAYHHQDFAEHRVYLEERVRAQQPVAYYPESAYWIAFDNSVPTYLPVYLKSRHLDLVRIREAGRLREHMLFSSGWEWGYWQTDVGVLRMNWALPSTWDAPVKEQLSPFGEKGLAAADLVRRLGDAQYDALITRKLGAYLASRDELLEAARPRGIVSQPERVLFHELRAMNEAQRAAFVTEVLEPFGAFAAQQTALDAELAALALPSGNPWLQELVDGFAVTASRGRFIDALYRAVLAATKGEPVDGWIEKAEAELAASTATVARRRKAMWDPDPSELLHERANPSFYQYGYLREADTLCFWKRERAQVRNLLKGETNFVPGCVL